MTEQAAPQQENITKSKPKVNPPKPRPSSEVYQLFHLLEARARIQLLNLSLLRLLEGLEELQIHFPYKKEELDLVASILENAVDTNFSLWRWAFLIYSGKAPDAKIAAMKIMLHGLLEDNSFLFGHEVAAQSWLGHYYEQNATYRIILTSLAVEQYKSATALLLDEAEFASKDDWVLQHKPVGAEEIKLRDQFVKSFNSLSVILNSQINNLSILKNFYTKADFQWPGIDPVERLYKIVIPAD